MCEGCGAAEFDPVMARSVEMVLQMETEEDVECLCLSFPDDEDRDVTLENRAEFVEAMGAHHILGVMTPTGACTAVAELAGCRVQGCGNAGCYQGDAGPAQAVCMSSGLAAGCPSGVCECSSLCCCPLCMTVCAWSGCHLWCECDRPHRNSCTPVPRGG